MSSGILSIGASALNAAYLQLQTTGNNIANVNVPGYHRQDVTLSTTQGTLTGAGFVGRGVEIVTVERRYEQFLETEVSNQQALASADTARAEQMSRLDTLFADPSTGVGVAVDDFYAALSDLSTKPGDNSARTVVYQRADALASRIRATDNQLSDLSAQVDQRVTDSAKQLTNLLSQVARLNNQIAQYGASSTRPNQLLDQRDVLVGEVNKLAKASTFINADGTVNMYAGSGEALVIGATPSSFDVAPDPTDASKLRLVMKNVGGSQFVNADQLGGGSIAGLLKFRDDDLQSVRAHVGAMAGALAGAFNAAQAAGLDATGAAGQPMFSFTAPQVLTSGNNRGSAALAVQIADSTALAATDYTATFDGSSWTVKRSPDGATVGTPGAMPQTFDGLTVSLSSGSAQAGDTFNLVSGSAMARDFRLALSSPSRIAAAQPIAAQTGAANAGDVKISALSVANPANANLTGSVSISFTGAGTYNISGPGIGSLTNQTYVPGQAITGNGWSLTLTGSPASGDTVTVAANSNAGVDNGNAKAMVKLLDSKIADGLSINDAWAESIADIGSRAQLANSGQAMSKQLLADAKSARDSASGVNLDEEAARMLQYQQAYQAAAKLISAAQQMFDALMNATSR